MTEKQLRDYMKREGLDERSVLRFSHLLALLVEKKPAKKKG